LGIGTLHMELCRVTHFGELPQNHNVLSVQCKGTQMRVRDDGRPMQWLKKTGLNQILMNNKAILNDALVQPLFPELSGACATRSDIEIAVHRKGLYPMHARVLQLAPEPCTIPEERAHDTAEGAEDSLREVLDSEDGYSEDCEVAKEIGLPAPCEDERSDVLTRESKTVWGLAGGSGQHQLPQPESCALCPTVLLEIEREKTAQERARVDCAYAQILILLLQLRMAASP
jgi:hypothetical protein